MILYDLIASEKKPSLTSQINSLLQAASIKAGLPTETAFSTKSMMTDIADFQCNGVLQVAKSLRKNPFDLATTVVNHLLISPEFSNVSVSGPGFINLKLSDEMLNRSASKQLEDPNLNVSLVNNKRCILIDFGGPNVAKPLHVGHLRSLIIGESVRRIFAIQGYNIISDLHLGDWGLQMGMLISEIEIRYPNLRCFDELNPSLSIDSLKCIEELDSLYPEASKACQNDPERMQFARKVTAALQAGHVGYRLLWEKLRSISLSKQLKDMELLNAHFDLFLGESDVQPLIPEMIQSLRSKGIAKESQGALIIDVSEETDKKPMPPLILEKSDGSALYATTDLATVLDRYIKFQPESILYVVDQRQSLHFEQVFRAVRVADYAKSTKLIHIGFGTVNGVDGKPYKTRDGGVARLSDLLEEAIQKAKSRIALRSETTGEESELLARKVGLAAIKFADLDSHRQSGYIFDAERLVSFEGRTGPYVQYACVRISSILKKAEEYGWSKGDINIIEPAERELVIECARFPDYILSVSSTYAPNEITNYVFNLAQVFHRFYKECSVMNANNDEIRSSRISLCMLAHAVLSRGLWLLGIEVPTRM